MGDGSLADASTTDRSFFLWENVKHGVSRHMNTVSASRFARKRARARTKPILDLLCPNSTVVKHQAPRGDVDVQEVIYGQRNVSVPMLTFVWSQSVHLILHEQHTMDTHL